MELSSTSMNVASVTVSATAQGLWLGRHPDHSGDTAVDDGVPVAGTVSSVATSSTAILTNIHTCMYVVKVTNHAEPPPRRRPPCRACARDFPPAAAHRGHPHQASRGRPVHLRPRRF